MEKPSCALERIRLDLADADARRQVFEQLGRRARKVLVITEGLLVPLLLRLLSFLPESNGRQGSRPWGGICLMSKQGA